MKVCPICDTKFDEEIIRFCTKDGTPLVEEGEPNFVELPSENLEEPEDDIGEVTVIRRKESVPLPPPIDDVELPSVPLAAERIVISTSVEHEPQVRPRTAPQAYYPPPPPQSNTLKVVALTVFGTIVVLGIGAGLFWLLQKERPSNSNVNLNTNLGAFNGNLNSNVNLNSFNFNANANFSSNFNANFNTNINSKTPSPTPTPKPSPSPSPLESPSPTPTPTPTMRPNTNVHPTASPTPRIGPRPTPNPSRTPGEQLVRISPSQGYYGSLSQGKCTLDCTAGVDDAPTLAVDFVVRQALGRRN